MPSVPHAFDTKAMRLRKLRLGMLYFLVACLLMALLFYALWPKATEPVVAAREAEKATALQGQARAAPPSAPLPGPSDEKREVAREASPHPETAKGDDAPVLQGPQAGEVVPPPHRNVTPHYDLSPLSQTKPLTRAEGIPLPPAPKRPPLPPVFRRIQVMTPTELVVLHKKQRVGLSLAYLDAPEEGRLCWQPGGQQAPCLAMGRTALRRFIRRRAIGCEWLGPDGQLTRERPEHDEASKQGQQARCYLGPRLGDWVAGKADVPLTDLGEWLVRFGWALPKGEQYKAAADEARKAKRGIYASKALPGQDNDASDQRAMDALFGTLSDQAADARGDARPLDLDDEDGAPALTLIAPQEKEDEQGQRQELGRELGQDLTDRPEKLSQ
jgi:endonuclease YncB( thermonuclease family)